MFKPIWANSATCHLLYRGQFLPRPKPAGTAGERFFVLLPCICVRKACRNNCLPQRSISDGGPNTGPAKGVRSCH